MVVVVVVRRRRIGGGGRLLGRGWCLVLLGGWGWGRRRGGYELVVVVACLVDGWVDGLFVGCWCRGYLAGLPQGHEKLVDGPVCS